MKNALNHWFLAGLLSLLWVKADACTIFVLKDSDRTLFFNNEDWSNPNLTSSPLFQKPNKREVFAVNVASNIFVLFAFKY